MSLDYRAFSITLIFLLSLNLILDFSYLYGNGEPKVEPAMVISIFSVAGLAAFIIYFVALVLLRPPDYTLAMSRIPDTPTPEV